MHLQGQNEAIKLVVHRQTDQPTDRQTDRETDIVTYRAAIAAKNENKKF